MDDRRVISGIIQVIISGCRWSDAPLEYGPRKTLYNRFVRWAVRGIWERVFMELARAGGPPAEALLDSTHIKVHRSASAGRRKRGVRVDRDELWRAYAIHLIADAHGRPKVIALTGGERHDSVPAQAMLARLPPDLRVIADAAYDSAELRRWLADRGSRVIIPNRKNRKQPYPFDAVTYRRRNIVERTFCPSRTFDAWQRAMIGSTKLSSPPSASPPPLPTSSSSQMSFRPSWTNHTWNWAVGCDPVSAGCDHCYAKAIVDRNPAFFGQSFDHVTLKLERLKHVNRFRPILSDGRKLPALVFVNSMSDAWHDDIPTDVIHHVFDVMEANPHIVFQVLTKRPIRARRILTERYRSGFPSHIWIGVSCEDNRVAKRLDILRSIKERTGGGMTAFVSVEPIIGPTDALRFDDLDWIITGGESGPRARIMQRGWLIPSIEECGRLGIALWHKQNGQMRSHPDLSQAPAEPEPDRTLQMARGERVGIASRGEGRRDREPPHLPRSAAELSPARGETQWR